MKIVIGQHDGKPVGFDLDTLISTRLLIQANSGAGKSYVLRKLMEQLFGHIPVIVIDPEGEFATLREKFGYVLVGKGGETPADVRTAATVAEKLLEIRASAVCDLYEMKPSERHRWVQAFLEAIVNAPKALWKPTIVIIDEAHVFCPEKGAGESLASESVVDLITRGRKRGFCAVCATQRLSKFRKDASAELLNRLVGGTFEDLDIKRAVDLLSVASEDRHDFVATLKTLDPGWFFAFGRAIAKERVLFKVSEVETSHPRPGSTKHAAEPPPTPELVKSLLPKLADLPKAAAEKARTIEELQAKVRSLTGELSAVKRQPGAPQIDKAGLKKQLEEIVSVALAERDTTWMRAVERYRTRAEQALSDAIKKFDGAFHALKFDTPPEMKVHARIQVERPLTPPPSEAARTMRSLPQTSADNNGKVSIPQLKILTALAQFEAIGRPQVPKKWIAAMSGASHRSSGYTNNLGYLRSNGYIDYPQPGAASLTESGRSLVPIIDPPNSSEEMLARCREIVTVPQASLLQVLHDQYPKAIDKDELAELARVSARSSGYTNNLGALRSAGMIDYPEPGKARAADWLFLE